MNISIQQKTTSIILFLILICYGDIDTVGSRNIGGAAGYSTGYGLSYRQWYGKTGFQVTTVPYFSNSETSSEFTLSLGATGLFIIKEAKLINLFSYLSTHYNHDYSSETPKDPTNEKSRTIKEYNRDLIIGAGEGLDFHFSKVSFSLMFGLAGTYGFDSEERQFGFTGETALYYSF